MFSARPSISNKLVERIPTGSFSHGPESSKFLSMGRKDSWTSCMIATFPWRSKTLPGRKSRVQLQRHKRKAEEEVVGTSTAAETVTSSARAAASSGSTPFLVPEAPTPKSSARPFLEPESPPTAKASSPGRPDASWSWNRDHYGALREWSYWRGAWYFRDGAGGRWILWNR